MASTKIYLDFILEQLSGISNLSFRPMMGEFLLYSDGILFGGVYDNRLLVKKVPKNDRFNMAKVLPYPGAKTPMHLVENTDDKDKLIEVVNNVINYFLHG